MTGRTVIEQGFLLQSGHFDLARPGSVTALLFLVRDGLTKLGSTGFTNRGSTGSPTLVRQALS
jgi:hypothetical protein